MLKSFIVVVAVRVTSQRADMPGGFQPGDVVVYRKQKISVRPGLNARDIQPAPHGDTYSYSVDKFWRVVSVLHDDTLLVLTRLGKQRTVRANDSALRRARLWERLLLWHRFPPRKLAD
jgi:hypothetical protein